MSESYVTRAGQRNARPSRDALTGADGVAGVDGAVGATGAAGATGGAGGAGAGAGVAPERRRHRGPTVVPDSRFTSYYGRPVVKEPVWAALDIAGYLFLGGLAGASSVLAAGADATGRPDLARVGKVGALGAVSLSIAALVHDLGRPARFVNMLRVCKPTSPMSIGSWLLSGYAPAVAVAAVSDLTGAYPAVGRVATRVAAVLGPAVASYTAPLICDTAVPAWHEGYRQMPFVFVGSAAGAAGGLAMLAAPVGQAGPARRTAAFGAALELAAARLMRRRLGLANEAYEQGAVARMLRASTLLAAAGAVGANVYGGRSRLAAAASGAALLASSALLRFGVFEAGRHSTRDPKYTVVPQRSRL